MELLYTTHEKLEFVAIMANQLDSLQKTTNSELVNVDNPTTKSG